MRPANSVVAVVDDEDNIRETVGFALRREFASDVVRALKNRSRRSATRTR